MRVPRNKPKIRKLEKENTDLLIPKEIRIDFLFYKRGFGNENTVLKQI